MTYHPGITVGKRKSEADADRYLTERKGYWYYQRKVPAKAEGQDARHPLFRVALGTTDVAAARKKRDALETADNALWGAMVAGDDLALARTRYTAAVRRVEAMGFGYRPTQEIAKAPDIDEPLLRVEALVGSMSAEMVNDSVAGLLAPPSTTISQAYVLYSTEIAADELVAKSEQQKRKWRNVKLRAVESFVREIGDIEMESIDREHGLTMWRLWQKRVAPTGKGQKPSHTASSGNREIGSLRTMYSDYFKHLGQRDRTNPFAGLSFKERNARKRIRPPFPTEWIRDEIMRPGALETMNAQLRGILLAEIETGARPSELANIGEDSIKVDADVPHIIVQPRDDPDDPRELKSEQSERIIPLIGVSLEVFRAFPKGFPDYREREEAASGAINKYMRENGLMPTPDHTLYGLRHSLEDRMKDAGIDGELRRILMGHKLDREEYGTGGSLAWRRDELQKIALPFDPAIVTTSRRAVSRRGPGRKKG